MKALFWIALPLLLWAALVHLRPTLITPHCIGEPKLCTRESVPPVDRIALGVEIGDADGYSYITQNSAGVIAVAGILGTDLLLTPGPGGWMLALRDLSILVQTTGWNGVGNEVSHLAYQRPRPFVYANPAEAGRDPSHYVSFWSGHTSFTAAAMVALALCLRRRRARPSVQVAFDSLGLALIIATAIFRIFAGRHFPTDVIAGAVGGSLIAYAVARFNAARL